MKAIIMSIRPQHVKNILNKIKTLEIRKRFPSDYVGWVYIYCTKDIKDGYLTNAYINGKLEFITSFTPHHKYRGKVIARFWCDKVDKVHLRFAKYCAGELSQDGLLKYACLTEQELDNYLWSNCCIGCAIHITKLEIFDKPKEISEFGRVVLELRFFNGGEYYEEEKYPLTRAPQSWCYVEI